MAAYAEGTSVSVHSSQVDIDKILTRYGATSAAIAREPGRALVAFIANGRQVRMTMPLPTDPDEFRLTPTGIVRTPPARVAAMHAETRRRWRALAMAIKAKLEVVATGISTFEEEWLAHIVLPDGALVRDHVLPAVEQAYVTGEVPPMLPGGSSSKAIEAGPRRGGTR